MTRQFNAPVLQCPSCVLCVLQVGASASALSVPASAHAADAIRCVTPSDLATGWRVVILSSYNMTLQSSLSFLVHRLLFVSSLAPPIGPIIGGTRVAIFGGGFFDTSSLGCQFFGLSGPSVARLVNQNHIECVRAFGRKRWVPPSSSPFDI